jgi:glycine betaine/proline transport system permease protein
VRTSPEYYIASSTRIGSSARFTPTFNLFAGLFGPVWFGARGLWNWAVPFLIVETLAFVQIARGLFGDLASPRRANASRRSKARWSCAASNCSRHRGGSDKVDVYKRTVASLEDAIGGIRLEAQQLEDQGIWIAAGGVLAVA